MILLAIDPGKNAGWALFAGSVLFDVARPANLVACGLDKTMSLSCGANIVIIEKPQVYRTRKSKGDPNDLIPVAIQVGRYQQMAIAAGAEVELVLPAEWKVQLSKEICAARILKALSPTERKIVDAVKCAASLKHNVLDAIGIGLFKLGRGVA